MMPTYDLRCTSESCGHRFEDYHGIKEPHPPCPACKAPTESVPARFATDRNFHGDEAVSRRWFIHPDVVTEAQRDMPGVAECIKPDGVKFAGRSQERAFVRAIDESSRRHQDQCERRAESELRAAAKG